MVVGAGARVLGNITIGENSRIGAGSVVLRDVPDNSTIVGVPGHIVFRAGKRVVITDPKQINDPLSEALAAVANEVKELKQEVRELQGREFAPSEGDRLRRGHRDRLSDLIAEKKLCRSEVKLAFSLSSVSGP